MLKQPPEHQLVRRIGYVYPPFASSLRGNVGQTWD